MAKLSSVIDGSSIVVNLRGKETKVRIHAIVTPPSDEKRPILRRLNEESAAFLREYLKEGWIYLEFPGGKAAPDDQGFISAYLYRGADATFVNEKLVSEGLAIVNRKVPSDYSVQLINAEKQAKLSQRGIWGSFANGSGEKIAAGTAQGNYLGVPGATESRSYGSNDYVTYWILLYY
jgi:endonuclease YncB( thermonuclease family)